MTSKKISKKIEAARSFIKVRRRPQGVLDNEKTRFSSSGR
ncbi:hypothetical protein ANRL2_02142 [Anaerolineae bacterium]|nr:hypothetical protein ANRL2_02142 [Anaerolineae bacterium]